MICLDFEWQTNEFMVYCRTTQLREKSMMAYEQTLRLFERWCMEEMKIVTVDKVTENVIRRYIAELQERGNHQQLYSQPPRVLQLSGTQLHHQEKSHEENSSAAYQQKTEGVLDG